jgi:hypothetical protein
VLVCVLMYVGMCSGRVRLCMYLFVCEFVGVSFLIYKFIPGDFFFNALQDSLVPHNYISY